MWAFYHQVLAQRSPLPPVPQRSLCVTGSRADLAFILLLQPSWRSYIGSQIISAIIHDLPSVEHSCISNAANLCPRVRFGKTCMVFRTWHFWYAPSYIPVACELKHYLEPFKWNSCYYYFMKNFTDAAVQPEMSSWPWQCCWLSAGLLRTAWTQRLAAWRCLHSYFLFIHILWLVSELELLSPLVE